ncbi:hypothetical protein ACFV0L_30525 [Streptosporangium canum]|uniref:hypothetical protein n=1 Tax=Streptosporangium canum TaxID=324952 RepID=UPI0036C2A439
MLRSLPVAARTLVWVRILNALGAYTLSFLAVLTGPEPAAVAGLEQQPNGQSR